MSGVDIFIAVLSAVMLFGGLYLNVLSRKMSAAYIEAHRAQQAAQKPSAVKTSKVIKK